MIVKKRTLYREVAYFLGIFLLSLGAACMERADFGMSMVIAPAYLIHLKVVPLLPWFSFGVAESLFQAALLVLMCLIIRKFHVSYLLSFVTAMLYGVALDLSVWLIHFIPSPMAVRIVLYVVGCLLTSAGVAFFFRTYIAPEVFELFVKKVSEKCGMPFHRMKTLYDIVNCVLSVVLSVVFFGFGAFVGVGWGTVVCATLNGFLIGRYCKLYDRLWDYADKFPKLRRLMPE